MLKERNGFVQCVAQTCQREQQKRNGVGLFEEEQGEGAEKEGYIWPTILRLVYTVLEDSPGVWSVSRPLWCNKESIWASQWRCVAEGLTKASGLSICHFEWFHSLYAITPPGLGDLGMVMVERRCS